MSGSPQPGAGIVKTVIIRTIPIMSPTASPQNAPASFVLSQNIAITNKTAFISDEFPLEFHAAGNRTDSYWWTEKMYHRLNIIKQLGIILRF